MGLNSNSGHPHDSLGRYPRQEGLRPPSVPPPKRTQDPERWLLLGLCFAEWGASPEGGDDPFWATEGALRGCKGEKKKRARK